eukprot:6195521-Pleurochrysis_carterae.AAC.7
MRAYDRHALGLSARRSGLFRDECVHTALVDPPSTTRHLRAGRATRNVLLSQTCSAERLLRCWGEGGASVGALAAHNLVDRLLDNLDLLCAE